MLASRSYSYIIERKLEDQLPLGCGVAFAECLSFPPWSAFFCDFCGPLQEASGVRDSSLDPLPRHAPWEAMASTAEGWKVEWYLWFELRSHSGLHPLNFKKNGQRNFGFWRTYKEIALGHPHGDASIAANQPGQLLPRSSCSSRSSSPTILGARVRVRPAKSKEKDREQNPLSRHGHPSFLRKVYIKH